MFIVSFITRDATPRKTRFMPRSLSQVFGHCAGQFYIIPSHFLFYMFRRYSVMAKPDQTINTTSPSRDELQTSISNQQVKVNLTSSYWDIQTMSITPFYDPAFNALTPYDQIGSYSDIDRTMRRMQDQMNQMMRSFGMTPTTGAMMPMGTEGMTWSPKVDVFDDEKQVTVRADLPGVPKENIKVEARDNTLFLSGETQKQEERTSGTTRIRERFEGSFRRTLPLPVSADTENVQAKFDHGVLEVVIPKRERPGGRRITIQ